MGNDGPQEPCPSCGCSNFTLRSRCRECGASLRAAPAPAPAAVDEPCPHAGYDFAKHGRCCPTCGEYLVDFGD